MGRTAEGRSIHYYYILYILIQVGRRENSIYFSSASIYHAITDPPVTKIRLWASFGV